MKKTCCGSFRTVSTDVAGAEYKRVKGSLDGVLKVKVPCFACGKLVGLRRALRGSRGVLAQHQVEPTEAPVRTPMGAAENKTQMELETTKASGPNVPLPISTACPKLGKMKVQDMLGAFLSAHGKHDLAAEAFASTDRLTWERLADEAIRSAPEAERTHVARTVKLVLDDPANGGPGAAQDFEIRPEPRRHPLVLGAVATCDGAPPMYRAYMLDKQGTAADAGLVSDSIEKLKRRIVGMYTAREIKVVKG